MIFRNFQCSLKFTTVNQGRHASLRSALALAAIFRAFGAAKHYPRGVFKFRSIEEAQKAREKLARDATRR